ncbi:MAG: hypothetical protein ACKOB3_01205 [Holophagaceae bacterium]|jgi:hypothetical protein
MKTSTNLISRFRIARMIGLVACVAWPLILMLLIMTEKVVPGNFIPEGLVKEFSYTLTGLTLAGTFFVNYRSGKVLSRFKDQPDEEKPHIVFRESLLYTLVIQMTTWYGLMYWLIAGWSASRHVGTFIMLTPICFFLFIPRLSQWESD